MAILSPAPPAQNAVKLGIAVIAVASMVALLYFGRDFFVTLIISAVFAFILDPIVELVTKLQVPRAAATFIVIGVTVFLVYVLGLVAWTQLLSIRNDLPTYSSRINEIVEKANHEVDEVEKKVVAMAVPVNLRQQEEQIQQKPQEAAKARRKKTAPEQPVVSSAPLIQEVRIHSEPRPLLTTAFVYASRYFHVMVMASFVPFLVYFMLSWRDHINQHFLAIFKGEYRYMVGQSWLTIGEATRAYVLGNFFLWIFVSSISAIAFFFLQVPYWPLIGPISAFLSLVPYVGLPLAVVPPLFAALAVPNKFKVVAAVLIFTASLHVLAMNFLYPKVVGRRVKLNPLAVTVAMMFWGLLWGGIGLVLAVPLTAAIKAVLDNIEPLQGFGKMLGD